MNHVPPTRDDVRQPSTPTKSKGCFFYGCVTFIIISIIAVVAVIAGGYWLKGKFDTLATEYTSETPRELPAVMANSAEQADINQRINSFFSNVMSGQQQELTLSSDQINMFLRSQKDLQEMAKRVYFDIEGDQIKGLISLQLKDLGIQSLENRYLNGSGTMKLKLEHGKIEVFLKDFEVKGVHLPEPFMSQISTTNLFDDARMTSEAHEFIKKLEYVGAQDGKLILRSKGQ